ncbi:MAG: peptidase M64 [Clostridiaceae bacterium]|nr:peptidase M64 [Clostridiaceae bacterium]
MKSRYTDKHLRKIIFIMMAFSLSTLHLVHGQNINYNEYFQNKGLRIDYYSTGNSDTTIVSLGRFYEQPYWSGPREKLLDPFMYGDHQVQIWDKEGIKMLFSKTYSSLYFEWQSTEEAKSTWRTFPGSIIVPYPKGKSIIKLLSLTSNNTWSEQLSVNFDPENIFISREKSHPFKINKVQESGNYKEKLDIVFLSEGYTKDEMQLFNQHVNNFVGRLFTEPPFDKNKDKINIWSIEVPSQEQGTDIPGDWKWNNTTFNSEFYTFETDRYLTTSDIQTIHSIASGVPFDQIIILVNSERYGGGGIYNFYAITTAGHPDSFLVLIHEFGHSFGGLADEYFSSEVAFEELHSIDTEPTAPNITSLVDFDSKWKHLLQEGTPIPTPIKDALKYKVGVYEGGGYRSKGIYRPAYNCYMKELNAKGFCLVCQYSLQQMIDFYGK